MHLLLTIIYLAFISLGLPDSLLGAAWPSIYPQFGIPVSYAGAVSFIIALGTVVSSLNSNRLTNRFGTGKVTAVSVAMTAVAIFGFSVSNSFWMLCLWAVPYGLGGGSIDAALNNYVALHYSSKHMSWLHCMWGVGTIIGPYVIGFGLLNGFGWQFGYIFVSIMQIILTIIMVVSLPLWKKQSKLSSDNNPQEPKRVIPLHDIIKIPGAKQVMITFFCYCALEQTAMLWASSYMVLHNGVSADYATIGASLLFIGITAGRAINGFLTAKFSDDQLVRIGQVIILAGIAAIAVPFGNIPTQLGFLLIGLGCAPIYPCIIHSTPAHFGAEQSMALIGVQMASAYVGTCSMPPIFGFIAGNISSALLPVYLLAILIVMAITYEMLVKKTKVE